ncbi:hypothetical protein GH714_040465 [Hevea brasiliensis]|uniref:Uncharacterized protein n=1 Tax=Hevea brasiliensis TaxID=3981 RepID=A0A6A6N5B7_HEVBR|nr:hypothetical protein GH714_040465 [Hevea brasiliensis]
MNNNAGNLQVVDLWYDWPNGRNFNIIQNQLGKLLYDLEWDNGTSYIYTLDSNQECRTLRFPVGVLRPNWLEGANYLGQQQVDGFLCNVWEKVDFIWYYEDVKTKRPVYWAFYTGMVAHVMTFEVGAVLEDKNWQAPVYCLRRVWRRGVLYLNLWLVVDLLGGYKVLEMGTGSESNGWSRARGLVVKTLVMIGSAILVKRLTKSTTRWDHARIVAQLLSGEKFSREQASRDPDNYFNIRMVTCPAAEMVDGSKVLYFEQAFWRTPQKPFRQRFYMVKPCPKELKCDVEVSSYVIRDAEEYKNFCDRPRDQRPLPEEVIGVWGVKEGPYEFKPAPASSINDMFSPLNSPPPQLMEKRIEGSFVLQE